MQRITHYSAVQGPNGRRGPPGEKVREEQQRSGYLLHTKMLCLNSLCLFAGSTWTGGSNRTSGPPGCFWPTGEWSHNNMQTWSQINKWKEQSTSLWWSSLSPWTLCRVVVALMFASNVSSKSFPTSFFPLLHHSIFSRLSGVEGRQLQLSWATLTSSDGGSWGAFPGHCGDIISPPSPGYFSRPPPSWTCQLHLPREFFTLFCTACCIHVCFSFIQCTRELENTRQMQECAADAEKLHVLNFNKSYNLADISFTVNW